MNTIRVALAQINPTVGDLAGNTDLVIDYIARARAVSADLVAFPELALIDRTSVAFGDLRDAFVEDVSQISASDSSPR